jgi:lysozyme
VKTSAHGRAFLIEQEGKENWSYPDPVYGWRIPTIGVGHTGPEVKPNLYWSDTQIDLVLSRDLERWEDHVNGAVTVPLSQNQFDALISFCHNLGEVLVPKSCTLLRLLNAGDYDGAADQFLRWDMAGGRPNAALHERRIRERALFLTPDQENTNG